MKKYIWLVIVSGLCLGLFSCEDGEFYFDDEEGDEGYFDDEEEPYKDDLVEQEPEQVEVEEQPADSTPNPSLNSSDRLVEAYTLFVEDVMEESNIPGFAVAVIRGDEVIMARGFVPKWECFK